ncbi:hypothetical protein DIE15_29575 [Burkholderia sp. Bp9031]|nr:hypothetical protein DIE15_29575 [Burkholderia sp. Bp9031]
MDSEQTGRIVIANVQSAGDGRRFAQWRRCARNARGKRATCANRLAGSALAVDRSLRFRLARKSALACHDRTSAIDSSKRPQFWGCRRDAECLRSATE